MGKIDWRTSDTGAGVVFDDAYYERAARRAIAKWEEERQWTYMQVDGALRAAALIFSTQPELAQKIVHTVTEDILLRAEGDDQVISVWEFLTKDEYTEDSIEDHIENWQRTMGTLYFLWDMSKIAGDLTFRR